MMEAIAIILLGSLVFPFLLYEFAEGWKHKNRRAVAAQEGE